MTLPDPVKVSPLIKLFRYALLLSGIIYGARRQKVLEVREESQKEEKARRAIEKAKILEERKKLAQERDLQQIIEAFGGSLKKENEDVNVKAACFSPEESNSVPVRLDKCEEECVETVNVDAESNRGNGNVKVPDEGA